MKFNHSIIINKPRDIVVKYFADPQYLKEYQDGFIKKELVSGIPGEDGAISKMYYDDGKRKMELTETITANRLPDYFDASYHHMHMDNTLKSTFTAISENQTRYDSDGEYTAFRGFIPKMMGLFFPGIFRRQAQKWLNNFKEFVEKN